MRPTFTVGAVLFLAAGALYAQNASLSGFIRDGSGAIVPKAAVQVRSINTGLNYATLSNESGLYFFGSLTPGTYSVRTTVNQKASFSVSAHSAMPMQYQWQRGAGIGNIVDIPGATRSTYEIASPTWPIVSRSFGAWSQTPPETSPAQVTFSS